MMLRCVKLYRHWIVVLLIFSMLAAPGFAEEPGLDEDLLDQQRPALLPHFHLGGQLNESPVEDLFAFSSVYYTSLQKLLSRMKAAREDPRVPAVIVTMGDMQPGFAQIEELHQEMIRYNRAGKRVYIHAEDLMTSSYALCTAATDLSLAPTSTLYLTGLHSEAPYLRGLLDKLGVEPQMLHVGPYKSAAEMFTLTGPSEAAQENMDRLLDGMYVSLVRMIADARGLSEDQVRGLIDEGMFTAEQALKAQLIDTVMTQDEFLEMIRENHGNNTVIDNYYGETFQTSEIDFSNPLKLLGLFTGASHAAAQAQPEDAIGLVIVEGMILRGYSEVSPFGGSSGAYSGTLVKALRDAAEDPSIKAVVLRVDSPGGSALASDVILNATKLVKDAGKPLVVSMGNVAASGGYYVSCWADTIFADENTITGSIGVVGGKLALGSAWDKIGVTWHSNDRGAMAGLLSSAEPWNEAQLNKMQQMLDETYQEFTGRVVKGRGERLQKPIEDVAGGRVYTGLQAREAGLVDEIGGLRGALEYTAEKIGMRKLNVRVIPEPKDFFTLLAESFSGEMEQPSDLHFPQQEDVRWGGMDWRPDWLRAALPVLHELEPRRAHALEQALMRIELLAHEHVILMPSEDWCIY
ncbi:signal peptide peptidase SppA [Candidatus Sumerlaeota bacterium]|nr:signal peptide peptidase SppA [Candidatus Sumerlaeota bacterium]